MIDFNQHIRQLLYRHDCVVLPGLGGFIVHEQPASYLSSSRHFAPPARKASFNGLLIHDDGLLVSRISELENIPYAQAKLRVESFTSQIRKDAGSVEGALLQGLGKLTVTSEGKLQFLPDPDSNFLERSYGLVPVYAQPNPSPAKASHTRSIKVRIDRTEEPGKAMMPRSVKWTVATAIPVILFLLWGIIFPASFQHYYASYSGFLTEFYVNQPTHADITIPPASQESGTVHSIFEPLQNPVTPADVQAAPDADTSDDTDPVVEKTEILADAASPAEEKHYHVIGGVFRNEENASKYVEALKALGYEASLVGTNRQGHLRVSYDSFFTWDEATIFLVKIQQKENPAAWILKY